MSAPYDVDAVHGAHRRPDRPPDRCPVARAERSQPTDQPTDPEASATDPVTWIPTPPQPTETKPRDPTQLPDLCVPDTDDPTDDATTSEPTDVATDAPSDVPVDDPTDLSSDEPAGGKPGCPDDTDPDEAD